tara:strand:- start:7282 stop:7782 length:501 start_codon:yes stop_codon:yes gene_type:complete
MNAKQRKVLVSLVKKTSQTLAHEFHVAKVQARVEIHDRFEERMGYVALAKEVNKLARQANRATDKIRDMIPENTGGRCWFPTCDEIAPSCLYGQIPLNHAEYQELEEASKEFTEKVDALEESTVRAEFAIEMSGSEDTIAKLIDSLDVELKGYLEAHFRGLIDKEA